MVMTTPRVLVVQHEPDTGAGWFGGWLTGAGLTLETVHPYAGQDLPLSLAQQTQSVVDHSDVDASCGHRQL